MSKQSKKAYQGWPRKTISTADEERTNWLKKLTLNKWSLTFAVMLVMFSAWMGLEEVDRRNLAAQQQEVLYVTDTVPYDIQQVNADVDGQNKNDENKNAENNNEESKNVEGKNVESKNEESKKTENKNGEQKNGQNNDEQNINEQSPSGQEQAASAGQGEAKANYSINSDSDFFINYRLEREKARSRQLELLQALIDDEKTSDDMRDEAQHKVIEQADAIEQELMLESILVAQYGGEAVVFIQPEKVNVVLSLGNRPADGMADREAEKIARLVDNYTGIGFENVIIVLKD